METNSEMKALEAFALTIPLEERDKIAKEAVEELLKDEEESDSKVISKIQEAKNLKACNGMLPSVFRAITLDGEYHVGVNFQPVGTKVGDLFHYDHGAGIHKNEDAMVMWIM